MKAPFDRITANCERDGRFQVERKPKTGKTSTSGQPNETWTNVVCPKCRMWADVVFVEEVR